MTNRVPPDAGFTTPPIEKAAIFRRAIAVLPLSGPDATGTTVIYEDGTTQYLSRNAAGGLNSSLSPEGYA